MLLFSALKVASIVGVVSAATLPPETCDPDAIQNCLARFERKFAECAADDLRCQCSQVTTNGANCYAACPQEAMTRFIKTYNDGQCASFDPFLSRRSDDVTEDDVTDGKQSSSESASPTIKTNTGNKVSTSTVQKTTTITTTSVATSTPEMKVSPIDEAEVRAITVTPSDPTLTISLSPQEYQSRLEKSRYKENLRSIRSERARISEEAKARLAAAQATPAAVNRQKSAVTSSATSSRSRPTSTGENKSSKSNASQLNSPSYALSLLAGIFICGLVLNT